MIPTARNARLDVPFHIHYHSIAQLKLPETFRRRDRTWVVEAGSHRADHLVLYDTTYHEDYGRFQNLFFSFANGGAYFFQTRRGRDYPHLVLDREMDRVTGARFHSKHMAPSIPLELMDNPGTSYSYASHENAWQFKVVGQPYTLVEHRGTTPVRTQEGWRLPIRFLIGRVQALTPADMGMDYPNLIGGQFFITYSPMGGDGRFTAPLRAPDFLPGSPMFRAEFKFPGGLQRITLGRKTIHPIPLEGAPIPFLAGEEGGSVSTIR